MAGEKTKVWDLFVRCFHWTLVALFVLAYLSGENWEEIHQYFGYGIVALVISRIFWGFAGSRHARFSSFLRSPSAAGAYIRGLFKGTARRYLGHNPAGGLMMVTLLGSLLLTCALGLLMLGLDGHPAEETWEEVHEFFANFTLFLVLLHVGGVIASSIVHRENLPRAMITGRKRVGAAHAKTDLSAKPQAINERKTLFAQR